MRVKLLRSAPVVQFLDRSGVDQPGPPSLPSSRFAQRSLPRPHDAFKSGNGVHVTGVFGTAQNRSTPSKSTKTHGHPRSFLSTSSYLLSLRHHAHCKQRQMAGESRTSPLPMSEPKCRNSDRGLSYGGTSSPILPWSRSRGKRSYNLSRIERGDNT